MEWIDQYTGKRYGITTHGSHFTRHTARVKTYGDVVREYEFHSESKCADFEGKRSTKQTLGLLQRRHIQIDQIKYIGKESNSLEEVEAGLTGWSFCTKASERVYITAEGCEIEFGATRGL